MRSVLTLILLLSFVMPALANEKEFVKKVLAPKYGMETDVKLQDGTVVDMSTSRYVIAVRFTGDWADAVGRAGYASHLSGRQAGVILLRRDCNSETERCDIMRCEALCQRIGIIVVTEDYSPPPYDKKPTPADAPPKRAPSKS